MGKIICILGGARSGKSHFAGKLAENDRKGPVAFIATAEAKDLEMKNRIALHQKNRPRNWNTFEEPLLTSKTLAKISQKFFKFIILDCLTLLISNFLLQHKSPASIEKELHGILLCLKKFKGTSILVSNEVGLGIVPANKLSRDFRDIAGRINQMTAEKADEVFFMISGIPWRIK
ncbi:MAG: bifunctional adenosylcobinamide kinase/adenosylcobinamide-phosphate guanylyltransferase [Candidatus Aureabacteria bacterium]|nr:bifunctional adenosylcobinamide kinase/adenosylcobinamide-phosphate guanylyltransferase [Candidatus Auribacterota bacterium]